MRRRHKKRVVPPGGDRCWTEVLPEDWHDNPEVLLVSAPNGSRGHIEMTDDGLLIGLLVSPRGTERCLQIGDPTLKDWKEHRDVAADHGYEMAVPDYAGPLRDVPTKHFLSTVRFPLIFKRDALHEPPLNLKNYMRSLTEGEPN